MEEALDLSFDRLLMMMMMNACYYRCRDSCLQVCCLRNTNTTIYRIVTSPVVSMCAKLSYVKGKTYCEGVRKYIIEIM